MRDLTTLLVLLPLIVTVGCGGPSPVVDTEKAPEPAVQWQLDWADGAVFYEVFVRSFADSDGDGVGDLRGLTARLDELNDGDPATTTDLGVEGLWLMPIFESPSYHGYDTVDYRAVDAEYGTLEDLQALLAAAHARGIRVVVDLMVNHTGADHPWFVESASSPDSPRRDWYVWRPDDPGWTQPWGGGPTWHEHEGELYYGIFWSGMPDLNFANPEVRAEVADIARYWLDLGVDGFRLDAARHLFANGDGELQNDQPETHAFWRELAATVRAHHPDALLIGENWTDTELIAPYYGSTAVVERGDQLPMSFNFPLAGAILEAVESGDATPVAEVLEDMTTHYPSGVLDGTFLTNHDMPRIATQLGREDRNLEMAASLLLTLPGSPFLYYGEEIGMAGDKPDPDIRTPMQWSADPGAGFTTGEPWRAPQPDFRELNVAAQRDDPGSLLSHYRRLIHLRSSTPALRHGKLDVLEADDGVLAFLRTAGEDRVLVVHNLGEVDVGAGPYLSGVAGGELLLATGEGAAVSWSNGVTIALPPRTTAVIGLE